MGRRLEHIFVDGIEHKRCSSCEKWKILSEFGINNHVSCWDGLQNCCKGCKKQYKPDPIQHKTYWKENREYLLQKKKEYRENHKDEILKKAIKYAKERRKNDVGFRIRQNLSRRICYAIHGKDKSKTTIELLGCSVDYLKNYLESQFTSKMNWENYGTYWHVDHKIPCAEFDLSDTEQQKICFNYKNLQPLFWRDNLRKSKKLEWAVE